MCDHSWYPIRSILWFKIMCIRCEDQRRVVPRWWRGRPTDADILAEAHRRDLL